MLFLPFDSTHGKTFLDNVVDSLSSLVSKNLQESKEFVNPFLQVCTSQMIWL